mgnify:FL=1
MASSSWLKTQRSGKVSERMDNMYIEAEEYNKNVQLKIGQRIQENREGTVRT